MMHGQKTFKLFRMSEYRTVLKATETKSVEATSIFPICCCLVYSAPYSQLLQTEAHQTDQNVCLRYFEFRVSDM
jgi:hypothetical protein